MRTAVYFDGRCPWCRRGVRVLAWLDWLGRLELADLTQRSDEELPVSRDSAMKGIPVRTSSGEKLAGWPGMRAALLETPLGVVPALVLGMPGLSWVARAAYDAVAAARPRDAVCGLAVVPPFGQGGGGDAGSGGTMPA